MRINFVRSGGLLGLGLAASLDGSQLTLREAETIRSALLEADFFNPASSQASPSVKPDEFHYRLEVELEDQRGTLEFGDLTMPEKLRPLVQTLTGLARPSPITGSARP